MKHTALSLASGENNILSLAIYGGFLYAGLSGSPGRIVKINLSTFTETAILSISGNLASAFSVKDGFLYCGSLTKIHKIDLSTFTEVATITLSPGDACGYSSRILGNYLYMGHYLVGGKISKVDLTTFTIVASLTLSSGGTVWQLEIIGDNLFAGLGAIQKIAKIDLTTFTETAILTMTGQGMYSLIKAGDYLMSMSYTLNPGKVSKIDPITFTVLSSLTLNSGESRSDAMFLIGDDIYVSLYHSPAKVIKIDWKNMFRVETLTFNSGQDWAWPLTANGNYLYCGTYTSPGIILKIDIQEHPKSLPMEGIFGWENSGEEFTGVKVNGDGEINVG